MATLWRTCCDKFAGIECLQMAQLDLHRCLPSLPVCAIAPLPGLSSMHSADMPACCCRRRLAPPAAARRRSTVPSPTGSAAKPRWGFTVADCCSAHGCVHNQAGRDSCIHWTRSAAFCAWAFMPSAWHINFWHV